MRLHGLVAVASVMLTGCVDGVTIGEPAPGSGTYYVRHGYVQEARALGDQAFASIRQDDAVSARTLFERSSKIIADGVNRHKVEVSDRVQTQRAIVDVGVLALGVIGAVALGNAAGRTNTPDAMAAMSRSVEQLAMSLQSVQGFANELIDDAGARAVARDASDARIDAWRAMVVSDDPIARSVVRIKNETKGGHCTGFFVSPWLIMTSAHCFRLGDSVAVYRQTPLDGQSLMRGEDEAITVTHYYHHGAFTFPQDGLCTPHDMALLLTKTPSEHYLPLSLDPPQPEEKLMVIGYSGDLNRGFFLRLDYGCQVVSGPDGDRRFRHDCASYGGNSGGPVLRTGAGRIAVIGAHSCGRRDLGGGRNPYRIAESVSLAEGMMGFIRRRPEAQGKTAGMPF